MRRKHMTDWKRGGWTGSLNGWVRREIHEHLRQNPVARRTRYSFAMRTLHRVFDNGSFGRFVAIYALLALALAIAEIVIAAYWPVLIPPWAGNENKQLLTNVTSYLITAQVTALGVVSIAIGLVTIIAQRKNASTDVQVYYHESLSFGLVASSIALVTILCAQLLWPVQLTVHWLGYGTELLFFKVLLTAVHIAWIILNFAGLAHFVETTLAFVQQKAREGLRERYTTNVVVPVEMTKRLRDHLYLGAGPQFVKQVWAPAPAGRKEPIVYLGTAFSGAGNVEIPFTRGPQFVLADVRMLWVQWVVRRWLGRCAKAPIQQIAGITNDPLLLFPARLDKTLDAEVGLCRRCGGAPLTRIERFVVRRAFKFRRKRNEV